MWRLCSSWIVFKSSGVSIGSASVVAIESTAFLDVTTVPDVHATDCHVLAQPLRNGSKSLPNATPVRCNLALRGRLQDA